MSHRFFPIPGLRTLDPLGLRTLDPPGLRTLDPPGLRTLDPPLRPPSTLAEIFCTCVWFWFIRVIFGSEGLYSGSKGGYMLTNLLSKGKGHGKKRGKG